MDQDALEALLAFRLSHVPSLSAPDLNALAKRILIVNEALSAEYRERVTRLFAKEGLLMEKVTPACEIFDDNHFLEIWFAGGLAELGEGQAAIEKGIASAFPGLEFQRKDDEAEARYYVDFPSLQGVPPEEVNLDELEAEIDAWEDGEEEEGSEAEADGFEEFFEAHREAHRIDYGVEEGISSGEEAIAPHTLSRLRNRMLNLIEPIGKRYCVLLGSALRNAGAPTGLVVSDMSPLCQKSADKSFHFSVQFSPTSKEGQPRAKWKKVEEAIRSVFSDSFESDPISGNWRSYFVPLGDSSALELLDAILKSESSSD